MTESIVEVLGKLHSVGIVFDDVALGCLAQLHIATQIVILEKIREYAFNPSLLLMSIIELEQTPRGAQKCGTVAIDAPDNKTPSAVAGGATRNRTKAAQVPQRMLKHRSLAI